jgi:hypothetical protein
LIDNDGVVRSTRAPFHVASPPLFFLPDAGDGIAETLLATRTDAGLRYERIEGEFDYGFADDEVLLLRRGDNITVMKR